MAPIAILEFTDPTCPFAWSAEPARRRMQWLYGDAFTLAPRMVGLHESGEEMREHGFTPEMLAHGQRRLSERHRMPMDLTERETLSGSLPLCRAVVAVRRHAADQERAMLRALRVEYFSGGDSEDPQTIARAADRAGLDRAEVLRWLAEPESEAGLREDMAAARDPRPEALALPGKLAAASQDGDGMRYTCPSWELERAGRHMAVPGFQPVAAYEIAFANLDPDLRRREDPSDVAEVLRWAGEPLASAEVAAVCDTSVDDARAGLSAVADEEPIGFEGLWTLRA